MLSVLIPTLNSERVLVPALSALVPGAAAGMVREVVLADGGSTDGTRTIADGAGCDFRLGQGSRAKRLKEAAAEVRGSWLMILEPAPALEEGWTREVAKFIESAERAGHADRCAAAFRLAIDGYGFGPRARELAAVVRGAFVGPRAEQGLLVSRRAYLAGRVARPVVLRTRIVVPA